MLRRWRATWRYWWDSVLPWWTGRAVLGALQAFLLFVVLAAAYEVYIQAANRALRAGR